MGVPQATPTPAWETSWYFTMPPFDSFQKFQTDGASASNLLKICFIQLEALHRSWWWYLTSMEFLQTFLRHWFSYHLRNVSGKPRWRVSGTRVLGSFQQNVSGSSGTSEKFVLFSWTEYSKRNFVFHLFRSSLIPGSLLHSRFSVNGTGLVKWLTLFDEEIFLIWILCNICPNRDLTGLTM